MACTQSPNWITYNPSTKALLSNSGGMVMGEPISIKATFSKASFDNEVCRSDKTYFLFHDKPVCLIGYKCYCGTVRLKRLAWTAGCAAQLEFDSVFVGTMFIVWNATLAKWEMFILTGCLTGYFLFYAQSTSDPRCTTINWTNLITSSGWTTPANSYLTCAANCTSNYDNAGTEMVVTTTECADICTDYVWDNCYANASTVTVTPATWTQGTPSGDAEQAVWNVFNAARTLAYDSRGNNGEEHHCDCIAVIGFTQYESQRVTWSEDFVENVGGTDYTVTVTATRLWTGATSYWSVSYAIGASTYLIMWVHCDGLGSCAESASITFESDGNTSIDTTGAYYGNEVEGGTPLLLHMLGTGTLSIAVGSNSDAGCKTVGANADEYFEGSCKGCQEGANWP